MQGKSIDIVETLNVLDEFIKLAESTYEVVEDSLTGEWHLEKKQTVYETIAQSINKLTGGPCWVWSYYKEKGVFIYKTNAGLTDNPLQDDESNYFNLDSINGFGVNWSSQIIDGKSSNGIPFFPQLLKHYNLSSLVILPLHSTKQADLVGIAASGISDHIEYNEDTILILEKLATQAALAVDHARLVERLSTLEDISASITKEANSLGVLRLILDKALYLPRFSHGQLYLADLALEFLRLVEWQGEEEDEHPPEDIKFGDGLLGRVASKKHSIYVKDINNTSINCHYLLHEGGSIFAVPIVASGNLLGVLSLESTRTDAFTELDRYFINAFAILASSAVWGFLQMMEVAYNDLVTATENHAWGSVVATMNVTSKRLLERLQKGIVDSGALRDSKILVECMDTGYRRTSNLYIDFDHGKSLNSRFFEIKWRIEPIPIDSVINDLLKEMQPELVKNNIKCNLDIEAKILDVNGVRPMLLNAFREILRNSIEELKEITTDRIISINLSSDSKNNLIIEIHDTGRGIPPEDRDKIFLRSYSSKREAGGIGLTIAKVVIEQHNGSIKLKTNNNSSVVQESGSTFVVNLPCRKGSRP